MKRLACALAAAITLAASVALTAPSVTASESTPLVPSGSALVRIDGHRAVAKKASDDRYFIVMPAGAGASWIGAAEGIDGVASGRFTDRDLVSSWARLGHRGRTGALTTLAWTTAAGQRTALARVSDPRINADGRLVFTARTPTALPRVLEDFSVNISGAPEPGTSTRTTEFPYAGNALGISGTTVSMNATARTQTTVDYLISGTDCPSTDDTQWTQALGPKSYSTPIDTTVCGVTFTTSAGAQSVFLYSPKIGRAGSASAGTEFWIATSTGISSPFTWTFMYWS